MNLKIKITPGQWIQMFALAGLLGASSASASMVALNPTAANAPVGSSTITYPFETTFFTATGFDNDGGIGAARELFFKNNSGDLGLGLVGTLHNELQTRSDGAPVNFIQLDLSAILGQDFINGQIKVGSVESGEAFRLYGSNSAGKLGTELATFGSAKDNKFVNLPDFGMFQFYSVASSADDVLPVAFAADMPVVPEMNALIPIIALTAAVFSTRLFRRRRTIR